MRLLPFVNYPSPTHHSRLLQLDFLRGVAILMVLINHQIPEAIPASGPIKAIAKFGIEVGWLGVDLFFVISGFLIGSLLFNELKFKKEIDVRRFLIRRGLRIWPAYYVFIFCVALSEWYRPTWYVRGNGPATGDYTWTLLQRLAVNVFNIQNYTMSLRAHTWSLAVEEHFYLALPFLLIALTRRWRSEGDWTRPIAALPWVTLALFIFCSGARAYNGLTYEKPAYFATHFRIDELFVGVLLAYCNCLRPGFTEVVGRHRGALMTVGVAATAGLVYVVFQDFKLRFTCITPLALISFSAFLMALITTPVNQGWIGKGLGSLPARVVAFIGVYSYSIYLWHPDLGVRPIELLYKKGFFGAYGTNLTWFLVMLVLITAEVFIGVATSKLIEEPVLALRDRLFPRRTSVITRDEAASSPESRSSGSGDQADVIIERQSALTPTRAVGDSRAPIGGGARISRNSPDAAGLNSPAS